MTRFPISSSRSQRNMKEKSRRNYMRNLIAKLTSLIPPQPSKLSVAETLDHAASYIMHLQKNEEILKKRRAALSGDHQETNNLTVAGSSSSRMLPIMNITTTLDSILEVNLICGSMHRNFTLYEIIIVLQDEGAEVINTTQVNAGDKVFYIIKSKVIISRIGVETSRVEERLKQLLL